MFNLLPSWHAAADDAPCYEKPFDSSFAQNRGWRAEPGTPEAEIESLSRFCYRNLSR